MKRTLLLWFVLAAAALAEETWIPVTSRGKPPEGVGVLPLAKEADLVFDRDGWKPEARLAVRAAGTVRVVIGGGTWRPLDPDDEPIADAEGWTRFDGLPAGPAIAAVDPEGDAPAPLFPIHLGEGEEAALDLLRR